MPLHKASNKMPLAELPLQGAPSHITQTVPQARLASGILLDVLKYAGRYVLAAAVLIGFMMPPLAQAEATLANTAKGPQVLDTLALKESYPSGSIQSDKQADEALKQVQVARAKVAVEFAKDERLCRVKFFATACISEAKDQRRRALASVKNIELEANQYKRRSRVTERDKALAEKRATDDAAAPGLEHHEDEAKTPADSSSNPSVATGADDKKNSRVAASGNRIAQHQAKLKNLQAKELADSAKRAKNIAAYQKKIQDAEERQKYIAEKKLKQ